MLQFFGLFPLPHGPKDDEGAEQQCEYHYTKAGGLEQLHRAFAQGVDKAELGKIHRDHETAAEQHDHHDNAHHHLYHEGLHIRGTDGAELDAEKRACEDDHREPDIDHAVHGIFKRTAQAHDECNHEFRGGCHQTRCAENVDHRRHADESADRDRGGQHPCCKAQGNGEKDGNAGVDTLEINHRARNIDGLHPLRELPGFFFRLGVAGLIGLPCVIQDETADGREDYDKGDADVEVGAGVTEGLFDVLLDLRAIEHPRFGRDAEDETELHVHLTVFGPLEGAHERLGELMAHIACHRHEARDAETHHARGENEGAAGADESAHETAHKTDPEQVKDSDGIEIDEVTHDVVHVILPPSFSGRPR